MKVVIQQEKTGCAIASCAAIAGLDYQQAKSIAAHLNIFADDKELWSDSTAIRHLLSHLNFSTGEQHDFSSWDALPECALLATKWHLDKGKAYWHWVVFIRDRNESYVLDSKKGLQTNRRTDFGRIKPKWFIPVTNTKD